ncbi:MAG: Flp pilus assembly complex ATPase component TadA [Clostridia bacterium]|nr:Flp pilus assembly complex ATPase component TadA [Clostridia bacterium]
MINVNNILKAARDREASDIHFICGLKPMLRINRDLTSMEDAEVVSEQDMWDIYDYFLNGSVEKDQLFRKEKILDCSSEFEDVRLRVNISYSDSVPVITTRLIREKLPAYEDLGVPDIVRRMTKQPQGLILVTGKTNSGKSTTLNALINHINETENRKILTLESPVEYKHKSKKSIIVQKEVGVGGDMPSYSIGTKNSLREDCDILIIGEIRDKETMEAAIETAESGHLVIGTLHTKSCAETIDRMINFYEVRDQATVKFLIASLLKLVISQRLIKNKRGTLSLVPEVMVVDNVIAGIIRKEKLGVSEIEDAIQSSSNNGNIGLINALANLFVNDIITLDQAKAQIEEKNIEILNRTIMQLKIKKQEESHVIDNNNTQTSNPGNNPFI